MKIGNVIIHTQYASVIDGKGFGGLHDSFNPKNWMRIYSVGRNYTSSGKSWFGWDAKNKRLNVWPFSIWFCR